MAKVLTDSLQDRIADRSRRHMRISMRDHGWVVAYASIYVLIVYALVWGKGHQVPIMSLDYAGMALVPVVFAVAALALGHVVHHVAHVRPFQLGAVWRAVRDDERLTLERAIYCAVPLVVIPFFNKAYSTFKTLLGQFQPYDWDPQLAAWDQWLHFGVHPWELLQPLLGSPLITSAISYLYNFWFGLMFLIVYWFVFSLQNRVLRMRYLLSFVLTWSLLGSLAAVFFASGGPVYYGHFVGPPDPFAPLMSYLLDAGEAYRNWSLEAQNYLWLIHKHELLDFGGGISAMPSLHVAVAALQALAARHVSRRMCAILTIYLLVIMVGSVHLGWHYAIDGYVSLIAVFVIWKLSGLVMRWHPLSRADNTSPL